MITMASRETAAPPNNGLRYRETVGEFCTGITIISSLKPDGEPVGLTCQTFSSLSLNPPLVQLSVQHTSTTWPWIRENGRFAVNILAEDQAGLARQFIRSGTNKFAGVQWENSDSGLPILGGVLAWLDCKLTQEVVAGDHTIAIGSVNNLDKNREYRPLLFFRGGIRGLNESEDRL